jgi:serine/threonine-protein kinase
MAPERAQGEYGGFKSDIFSLGIISFEAASGRPPFGDLKGNDVIRANEEAPISLPKEVLALYPQGMEALMEGMLEKDPGRRWDAEKVAREAARLQLEARGTGGR